MDKTSKISLVSSIIIVGFFTAVLYCNSKGIYLGLVWPYNTFLFNPNDKFMDFYNLYNLVKNLDIYTKPNFIAIYFPFSYFICYLFTFMPANAALFLLDGILAVFMIGANYKYIWDKSINKFLNFNNLIIFSLFAYPVLFTLDRANLEIFVFIFLAFFVYLFTKQRYFLSAIFLSMAVAMKLYPIILALLFLPQKKYKEIMATVILPIIFTFGSFSLFKGDILSQISMLLYNQTLYKQIYIIRDEGLAYGSSLYGAIKAFLYQITNFLNVEHLLSLYVPISILLLIIFCYCAFKETVFWKKITLLIVAMLLLPPVTGDYRLLSLFIPLWLFINSKETSRYDLFYTMSFGLLLIPKSYPILIHNLTISVIVNPLIMLFMAVLIIGETFQHSPKSNLLTDS